MAETQELIKIIHQKTLDLDAAVKSAMDNTEIDGSNVYIPEAQYNEAKQLKTDLAELKSLVGMSSDGQLIREGIAFEDGEPVAFKSMNGGYGPQNYSDGGLNGRSVGQAFTESEDFKSFRRQGVGTMAAPWQVKAMDIAGGYDENGWGQKDLYTGAPALGNQNIPMGFGRRIQVDPVVPYPQRRTRVRDLFPVATTTSNLIMFVKVLGFTENDHRGGAASVSDYTQADNAANPPVVAGFTTKPRSNLRFSMDKAPVETIAHWEAAHRNILQDEPQLRDTIDNALMYGLRLTEDYQLLLGSGEDNELRGILNTPDIQKYTPKAGDSYADTLRRSLTKVALAYYPANGFVLNPNDWEKTELTKATGDGQYVLVSNVSIGAQQQVWRQPVVETPAMTEGRFLTGAFGLGAQIYDRQEANIRIAEQHGNFFVQNAVAILAEQRIALAVKRPESMVDGDFTL